MVGLDISTPMLARAAERVKEAQLDNVSLERADAQTYAFSQDPFDLVFSRFGVMFFEDPRAAFANLLRSLRPGGRLTFVCWRTPEENQWVTVTLEAAAQHIAIEPRAPGEPGPFAFSDGDGVRSILADARFEDIAVEPHDETVTVGGTGTLDQIARNLAQFGPVGGAIRQAGVKDTSAIETSLKTAIAPFAEGDHVRMGAAVWIVSARRAKT